MALESNPTNLADFVIKANGSSLPITARGAVTRVLARESIDRASCFEIELNNWDDEHSRVLFSDDAMWDPGTAIEIEMGYEEAVKPVLQGEVTGLELSFREGRPGVLVVRGYDRLHRLRRGRRTKSHLQVKDSDVAQQIASNLGLDTDVEDSGEVHAHLMQRNQTDIDFLLARARAIGYELSVEGRTLRFRKSRHDRAKTVTVDFGHGLIGIEAYLSTADQVGKVTVRGWDPKAKQALVGNAQSATGTMGGNTTGPAATDAAFSPPPLALVELPVATQGEADLVAQAVLDELALDYVGAELTAVGNPDIRAGAVIEIGSVGTRFSGLYQVAEVTHAWESRYVSRARLRRNAA